RYDRHLIDVLDYRGHLLIRDAAARLGAGGDVLDLGCGTGLTGAAVRSRARRLAGIDLSPRMIDKARALEIYDSLEVAELIVALEASPASWDLLVAADVLGYLGELGPTFQAAAAALRPGGLFLGTVEELAEGDVPVLRPTRRFAHPASHVRDRAAAAGLDIALFERATLRREKGVPVGGLVFALRRLSR
ncbi:MAG: methyltransferase domain-containing protein, partial [Alphaproteobacteria bacterium]|nr:methyltransferase domain-containing protein [Alphaproteobacteria bacterium]